MSETRYDDFETVPQLPNEMFAIPKGYERLFPETPDDYHAMLRNHSAIESIKRPTAVKKSIDNNPKNRIEKHEKN